MRNCYRYNIIDTITGLKYHGVRFAKNCNIDDKYMGSSSSKMIEAIEFRKNLKLRPETSTRHISTKYLKESNSGFYNSDIRKLGTMAAMEMGVGACYDKELNKKHRDNLRDSERGFWDISISSKCGKIGGKIGGKMMKGKIWIHKLNESKMILPEELNDYLLTGWIIGRGKIGCDKYEMLIEQKGNKFYCIKTNKEFKTLKDASRFLCIPYSSVRRYTLNKF